MFVRTLPDDCVLVRTPAGARKMRDRGEGLAPKLRSVLFLVDGSRPVHELLERAGMLGGLLESQFLELLDLGLVECRNGKATRRAPAVPRPTNEVAGIVGAKIRLLDALEQAADARATAPHAGAIIDARNWRDLAYRTRAAAVALEHPQFWARAKQILVAARDGEGA